MAAAALPTALSVYWSDEHVGTLHRTDPLSFAYARAWLDKAAAPLHPHIPLAEGTIATPAVHAFFENLLPEADQRRIIGLKHQVSSVFGLLALMGGDTAGAIVLTPEGERPTPPAYQRLTWDQVNALLHADGKFVRERAAIEAEAAAAGMPVPRLSLSGAQLKMLLSIDENGNPWRPMGTSPSTHILKPDIVRTDLKLFASAVNETIVMRAARICELPTARVAYQATTKACLIERYDRYWRDDRALGRLWQADFCQIAGKASDEKYEADGGPTLKECYSIIRSYSVQPAVDLRNFLRWIFFNLYVGNNDCHAKNLSMLAGPEGLRLAPFYDLMSTRVYPGLAANFAFRIGGESEPGKLASPHLASLADELGLPLKYLTRIASQVKSALPQAVEWVKKDLGPNEAVMAARLQHKIASVTKRMQARLCGEAPHPEPKDDLEDAPAQGPHA